MIINFLQATGPITNVKKTGSKISKVFLSCYIFNACFHFPEKLPIRLSLFFLLAPVNLCFVSPLVLIVTLTYPSDDVVDEIPEVEEDEEAPDEEEQTEKQRQA